MKLKLLLQLFFISVLSLPGNMLLAGDEKPQEAKVFSNRKNHTYKKKAIIATTSLVIVSIVAVYFLYGKKQQSENPRKSENQNPIISAPQSNNSVQLPINQLWPKNEIIASLEGGNSLSCTIKERNHVICLILKKIKKH